MPRNQTRRAPRRALPGRRRRFARRVAGMRWARPHSYRGKFGAMLKSTLLRNAESKYVRSDILTTSLTSPQGAQFNSTINQISDFYRAFPETAQGNQSHQRMGQRITPTKIQLDVNCAFSKTDALSRDIEVHLFVLHNKTQRSVLQASGVTGWNDINGWMLYNQQELLDNGTGANTTFAGTYTDTTKKLNNDGWTLIKHKKYHLYKGAGTTNNNQVANNERRHFSARINLPCKQFIYDEQTDGLPTNYAPCFAIGYRYLDGTDPDTANGVIFVQSSTQMWFKDV